MKEAIHFKFDVTLTDKDYLDLNLFVALKSHYGKGQMRKLRVLFAVFICVAALLSLIGGGFSPEAFLFLIPYAVLLIVFEALLVPFFALSIKGNIKALKKQGKMAFHPVSAIEFFDESITETTPEHTTKLTYSALERISEVDGNVIYLHLNSLAAYILPRTVFESDSQYKDFLAFIKTKCANFDTY